MKNVSFATNLGLLSLSLAGVMATSSANAQTYLVGAYLYGANSSGVSTNTGYQYDTNSNSGAYALSVNGGGKSLSQLLATGSNAFTFSFTTGAAPLTTNGNLGLFFNSTNTPYNPATDSRTPDLLVSATANGGVTFFTPAAGALANDYHYGGTPLSANGLTAFNVGGNTVDFTAFSVTSTPTGSFTLRVTPTVVATPEPGIMGLLAGISVSGGVFAMRRRRNVKK